MGPMNTHLEDGQSRIPVYFRPAELHHNQAECRGEIVTQSTQGLVMLSPIRLKPNSRLSLRILLPNEISRSLFLETRAMGHVVSERRLQDGTLGHLIRIEVVFSGTSKADWCDGSPHVFFWCQEAGCEHVECGAEVVEVFPGGFLMKSSSPQAVGNMLSFRLGLPMETHASPSSEIRATGRVIGEEHLGPGRVSYRVRFENKYATGKAILSQQE
jgi:hypothetical protein